MWWDSFWRYDRERGFRRLPLVGQWATTGVVSKLVMFSYVVLPHEISVPG
jgi:hypothetical protein